MSAPRSTNLIESAIAAYRRLCPTWSLTDIIAQANADTGRSDTLRRWGEFRRGDRPIPADLQRWLLEPAVREALWSREDDESILQVIVRHVSPPERG